MSLRRQQRAIRQIGGFTGGTSRLARPPAVLEEPDIRPCSPEHIGTFDAADDVPQFFAVDETRGYLYGTFGDAGLRRFTYPGLVNTEGAGTAWFDDPDTEITGVTVRPSDGDIILDSRGTASGDGRSYFRVDFASEVRFLIASEAGSPGVLPRVTLLAWHTGDSTTYGLLLTNPVRLIEVDVAGSSVNDPVATFTGMTFAGSPHITPDGAIWFIAIVSGVEVVARYDGTLDTSPTALDSYGFGRCDNSFWLPSGEVWQEWSPALASTPADSELDPFNATSYTSPEGEAWVIQANGSAWELWKVPCC